MRRRFCPTCGVQMFSEAEERPHLIIIRVGALDNPDLAAPKGHIRVTSAPSWACPDPDLPKSEAQPQAR